MASTQMVAAAKKVIKSGGNLADALDAGILAAVDEGKVRPAGPHGVHVAGFWLQRDRLLEFFGVTP